jgi:hypothetical protein
MKHDVEIGGAGQEGNECCGKPLAQCPEQRDNAEHVAKLVVLPDDKDAPHCVERRRAIKP